MVEKNLVPPALDLSAQGYLVNYDTGVQNSGASSKQLTQNLNKPRVVLEPSSVPSVNLQATSVCKQIRLSIKTRT